MLVHRRVTPQQYVAGTHLYKTTKNKLKKEQRYYAVAVAVMEHFSVSYSLNKSLKAKIHLAINFKALVADFLGCFDVSTKYEYVF